MNARRRIQTERRTIDSDDSDEEDKEVEDDSNEDSKEKDADEARISRLCIQIYEPGRGAGGGAQSCAKLIHTSHVIILCRLRRHIVYGG